MEGSAYTVAKRGRLGWLMALAIILVGAALGWIYINQARNNPLSDDAILTAYTVNIASTVGGRIVAINVKENDKVRPGDLLFSIDQTTYRIAVDQASADLKIAEALRNSQQRAIAAEQANSDIANEQIVRAKTNATLAEQTLARMGDLYTKGFLSRQRFDDIRTVHDNAQVSLSQAQQLALAANALINTVDTANSLVQARQAALELAQHNLANTDVRAFHEGRVVGLTTATGQIVAPGQSIFTLIDTASWYASASFSETELDKIKVGDCARVYVLADRSRAINGRVDSIGWGVSSEELVNIPRNLPYVPKTLNWVRLSQRFPVRVKLIDPPENLTRIGASAVVVVRHDQRC
jgi:membrane fusion protein, multidrug efflux system